MRNTARDGQSQRSFIPQWRVAAGGMILAVFAITIPSAASAQAITITATPDSRKPLELSDHVRMTLAIEGLAPLSVEFAKSVQRGLPPEAALLAEESSRNWTIRAIGKPSTQTLANGREKWSQEFRLDPYVPGEWYVKFAPVKVNGRELEVPGIALTVNPTKATEPQNDTGIESLPPLPPTPSGFPAILWWGLALAVVVAGAIVLWRWRSASPPVSPAEWAIAAFAKLERDGVGGAALVERVADVLREFIERRFGIPATRFTTHELLAAAEEQPVWSIEETDALKGILDRCDRTKFAGDIPDDDGCRSLLAAGRNWIDRICAADAGPR